MSARPSASGLGCRSALHWFWGHVGEAGRCCGAYLVINAQPYAVTYCCWACTGQLSRAGACLREECSQRCRGCGRGSACTWRWPRQADHVCCDCRAPVRTCAWVLMSKAMTAQLDPASIRLPDSCQQQRHSWLTAKPQPADCCCSSCQAVAQGACLHVQLPCSPQDKAGRCADVMLHTRTACMMGSEAT